MIQNVIDAQLSTEDENLAVQKLKETENLFPFMVKLSPQERQTLPKMGKKTLDFVERTMVYAKENPGLVPPFLSIEAQQRDMALSRQVQRILAVLEPFCEKLRDTYMLLGSEAYAGSRVFYTTVKGAAKAGVPGSETIAKDLGERFKLQFSDQKEKKELS